ncbi:MAG: sulfite exporter TauE/SafE family protein [Acidobacteriaceae bacterium]|nr:sulfite exporter TauE/SafE family protein [Acidobacteriaceae bacterium]MBV9441056.1 sulfite exporter TauE/SafE family protein [Acidobacteriaceae bacterium]
MNAAEFTGIVLATSALAGFVGSLTGLGGGVIVTPALTVFLGVDIRYAIGASLISVIATSSGAAAAYVREGFSNIRIGMFLEIATTLGAIFGAFLASRVPTSALSIIFGIVLLQSAWQSAKAHSGTKKLVPADPLGERLKLNGIYISKAGKKEYEVHRIKTGFGLMFGAGTLSGLLGIGSGSLKVIAMDQVMQLPFKVSTATSNFMIGVTAAASAGLYISRGYVDAAIAMPVMLGVLSGSLLGARMMPKLPVNVLRRVFAVVVAVVAIEMIVAGLKQT